MKHGEVIYLNWHSYKLLKSLLSGTGIHLYVLCLTRDLTTFCLALPLSYWVSFCCSESKFLNFLPPLPQLWIFFSAIPAANKITNNHNTAEFNDSFSIFEIDFPGE